MPVLKAVYLPESRTNVKLHTPNNAGDMDILIGNKEVLKTVSFRNVGTLNVESSIQFTVQEFSRGTNRTKFISFSIPFELVEDFIKHLQTIHTPIKK